MNSSVIQLYMVSDSEAAPPGSLPVLPIEVSAFQLKMGFSSERSSVLGMAALYNSNGEN